MRSHEVDGIRNWRAAGRADIILRYEDQALAVVELKRQGLALTDDDSRQLACATPRSGWVPWMPANGMT